MRRSHSTSSPGATMTPDGQELRAILERRPSGKFRIVVFLGPHPITGKPLRLSRTFDTEHEALSFRDALLEQPASILESLRHRLRVAALPELPGYPERRIYLIRGQHVMLDADVAQLFGTRTGWLNQAVSRHRQRFPDDFAFHLTPDEVALLRYLGAVKPPGQGGRRTLPRVFTDLGLLMVAAILKSPAAVKLNLEVIRAINAASQIPDDQEPEQSQE
jgi:hypothetical protein